VKLARLSSAITRAVFYIDSLKFPAYGHALQKYCAQLFILNNNLSTRDNGKDPDFNLIAAH